MKAETLMDKHEIAGRISVYMIQGRIELHLEQGQVILLGARRTSHAGSGTCT